MKLNQLFSFFSTDSLKAEAAEVFEREVKAICFDTRQLTPDSVFVAIRGLKNDGHDYLLQAIAKGAIALVVEDKSKVPSDYPYLVVELADTRAALDMLASKFYAYPSQDLFCFGVTGTNGKTSITSILEHILNEQNKMTAVMGTINHRLLNKVWPSEMTTPDAVTLQSRMRDFCNEGAVVVALEVSSHALDQKRVSSVNFNTVIFTNLTLDHLDYHKSMQIYFEAKQKLFTDMMWMTLKSPKFAVINIDDSYGRKLKVADEVIAWTYGKKESDFQFKILNMNFAETEFELKTAAEILKAKVPLTGEHSIYNVVASCVAALTYGVSFEQSFKSLQSFAGVAGRLERVATTTDKIIFVDYAHTPDALSNVLKSLNQVRLNSKLKNKIITVFGCGGDRDKSKRPLMGEIAASLSDHVIVTTDNPRTENPQTILEEIKIGVPTQYKQVIFEIDRKLAIQQALDLAKDGDVVLIAGKGHEDYQIIGTEKKYFSDVDVVKKYLN